MSSKPSHTDSQLMPSNGRLPPLGATPTPSSSIGSELFRKVFSLYVVIALLTTTLHMWIEFKNTKNDVQHELKIISESIAPGIAKALWDFHDEQILSIVQGTLSHPSIIATRVQNEYGDDVYFRASDEADLYQIQNMQRTGIWGNRIYEYSLNLEYNNFGRTESTGRLTVYSGREVVWSRIQLGFTLILINSLFKSLVLWALFIFIARKTLTKPMNSLTSLIHRVRDEGLFASVSESIKARPGNELDLLEAAFIAMKEELKQQQKKLRIHNDQLEATVAKRTQSLREAYKTLEETRKSEASVLERKRRFMSDISHELRTPLAVLRLQVEVMESGIGDIPDHCSKLQRKVSQMERIIGDLSTLAQADCNELQFSFEKNCLHSLLVEIYQSYQALAVKSSIALNADFSAMQGLQINSDIERLRQVFNNLLNNAVKYTDSPGEILLGAKLSSGNAVITIDNSGPGVSDSALPRLFERMYREDGSRSRDTGGAGLGLSICKSLVEAHRGEISATHSKLGGLKVVVTLPVMNRIELGEGL
ncbi:sensor histidine kinase [Agaribacterium haliotis]|uniref:sensor histidine kinase n=1 Tax=Agaribacterium haliotis TaxID=2013869 RepID=UPI000BB553EE|nr:ATP-binding protein [Agaribacterium haliotis]